MVGRCSFICNVLMKSFLLICTVAVSGCSAVDALVGPLPPADGTYCPLPAGSEESPYQYAAELVATQAPTVSTIYTLGNTDARQRAFSQLMSNVEHLSDQVDIVANDTNMVRITITYLDPELIQYIILNHYLNDPVLINEKNIDNFNSEMGQIMKKLADRNEILFLVTITSPFYFDQAYNSNVLTVKIPITEMKLINGSGREIKPSHPDYILNAPIDITHGPVSGIVAYPVGVINQGQCASTVDKWTNSLTLLLPKVTLGNTDFTSPVWNIPYRSLLMSDGNYPTPTYDPLMEMPVSKLEAPPTPHWIPNAKEDPTNPLLYWNEMGKYIWNYMINQSHR